MASLKRHASSLLFAGGLLIVFGGLSAALGFTLTGILASLAVVAALLYAGGVWFGAAPDVLSPTVFVFDRDLRIAAGPRAGEAVVSCFPVPMRAEIERRCTSAIAGHSSHFVCRDGNRDRAFDVAPVLTAQPSAIGGVLVEGAAATTVRVAPHSALSAV